jgi:leucyl aminopeptidase
MTRFRAVRERAEKIRCDLLAVPIYAGGTAGPGTDGVARALGGKLSDLLKLNRIKGEVGDALVLPTLGKLGAKHVALIGLGKKAKAGAFEIRRAAGVLAKRVGTASVVATTLASAAKGSDDENLRAFVEGFLLGSYRFDRYKKTSKDGVRPAVKEVLFPGAAVPARVVERARAVAEATALARDLTNVPAGDLGPSTLASEARKIARRGGVTVRVLDEKQLAAKGFGGILGVGRGSAKPPRLIEIRYAARGAKRTVAIVGKGITYDSGGLNLKTEGLDWMKMDMGGGAAVVGTLSAVARLKPKVNVLGLVCSAENMPGGNALHTGDVLTMYGGKTVEVGNTDAEGRLVMADGIVYAKERGADVVLDIATLTGASMIALGPRAFAVLGNDRPVVRGILDAAARAGEYAWELPIYDEYRKMIDSDIADIRNIGGRYGGAITAALFLKEFVGDTPWAHLDIAGTAKNETDEFELPKGATGSGVRTLVEWLMTLEG